MCLFASDHISLSLFPLTVKSEFNRIIRNLKEDPSFKGLAQHLELTEKLNEVNYSEKD